MNTFAIISRTSVINFFVYILSVCFAPQASEAQNLDDDLLARAFSEILLGTNGRLPIAKWQTESARATVIFEPEKSDQATEVLYPLLKEMRTLIFDETEFLFLFPKEDAKPSGRNVFIQFGSPEELFVFGQAASEALDIPTHIIRIKLLHQLGLPVCSVSPVWDESYALKAILMSIDSTQHIEKCVRNLFVSAMGLFGETELIDATILSLKFSRKTITENDRLFLRALYSGSLNAGQIPSLDDIKSLLEKSKK